MRLCLIKIFIIFSVFFFKTANANNFNTEYAVSTSGIKIGEFNWVLKIEKNKYHSEINLKNSGIFSPLYSFKGRYSSLGIIQDNIFKSKEYKQYWETKKKVKIVEMSFNDYLTNLYQNPKEKELSRIDLYNLYQYFDPITSFINILSGNNNAKTVDGRRIYIMEKLKADSSKNISIKIRDYKNIWADHQRNDLKKVEFYLGEGGFFPEKILIYFKDRIFKLKKI